MTDLTYAYKNRPFIMLFLILFGAAFAALFVYMALYDEDLELRFLGFYAAGWEATALAWCFAVFMAGLGLFGVYALLQSFRAPKSVVLTDTALIAPKAPVSKKLVTIRYAEITKLQKEDVINQIFLTVHFADGKVSIPKSYLADPASFDDIHREVQARWDAVTGVNFV